MSEKQNKSAAQPATSPEMEIDLVELVHKVWDERKLVFKWVGVALLIGLVIAFSIPKEYATTVTLAPESGKQVGGGSLGALGSLVGANLSNTGTTDALSPELFPDIVSTTPFMVELLGIKVTDLKHELPEGMQLYEYLDTEQRKSWWSYIFNLPFQLLGWITSLGDDEEESKGLDPFQLTYDQTEIVKALQKRIAVSVDKKTSVTSITVTMQDPLISATLADTVTERLKMYITEYRTNKARNDLAYAELLYSEARQNYYVAQQAYAKIADQNLNVARHSYQAELDRLMNEKNLTYGVYNNVAQQLQMAKAKVQEETPVFAVVQPATVPVRAAKPRKVMILIGCMFLAGVAAVGWVLFGREFIHSLKRPSESA